MSGPSPNTVEPVEPLTRREREILSLLAQGLTGPEIAEHLTVTLNSVKWHTQHLYRKLGVTSKKQAVARARAQGLLAAPPSLPKPERKHNLPLQVTRFFGREREVTQLVERLRENRLVTLTGPGGVGKTRLSLRTAETLLPDFADGVWLVELAPLSDPTLVPQQVAASLGLRDDAQRPVLETLIAFLRDRQVLLVLDNCEHVLATCGWLAEALLRACPGLRLLATSREPLGIAGEAGFAVPSLSFPGLGQLPPLAQMTDYMAVSLFLDRARLVLPDYALTAGNAAALVTICQRLDGIPLALEMAAARVTVLSPEQLAQRLDDLFRVLTGGSRTALPRQQTLRATLDWSYQLLSDAERCLLQRLSVFAGGCTLEATEAVCSGDGLETGQVMDALVSLVAKSIVSAELRPSGSTRYHLLETVRQYAREKLVDVGDGERWRQRHRDYFLTFAETNWRLTFRWGDVATRLEADIDNARLALQWSFAARPQVGDRDAGPKLVLALRELWPTDQEQGNWYQRSVAWCRGHSDVSAEVVAFTLIMAAFYLSPNDRQAQLRTEQEALAISCGLGPRGPDVLMTSLYSLGMRALWDLNDLEQAAALIAEAETHLPEVARQLPQDEYLAKLAWFAKARADLASREGRYQEAKQHASVSLRYFQQAARDFDVKEWGSQIALIAMGSACLSLEQYDQAREHFLHAQRLTDSAPGSWRQNHKAAIPHWLARVDYQHGPLDRAQAYARESLREAERVPDFTLIAANLALLAGVAAQRGQLAHAARLAGAAEALYAQYERPAWDNLTLDRLLPGWRDGPDAALTAAFEAGQGLSVHQALVYALGDDAP